MYKKIMVVGMVLLIMFLTPLPSFASSWIIPTSQNTLYNYANLNPHPDFNRFPINYRYVIYRNSNIDSDVRLIVSNKKLIFNSKTNKLYSNEPYMNTLYILNSLNGNYFYSFGGGGFTSKPDMVPQNCSGVLWSDTTVYNADGNIIYTNDVPNEFDGRITLPATDGYRDNGTTFSFWQWYQLPTGIDSTDIEINPYVDDLKTTYFSPSITLHQKISNTNKWNLNLNLTVYEYGQHTYKIVFKQKSTGNIIGTLTRTFEALEGFIDENGDGLDDRTNQPPYIPLEPPGTNPGTSPEWDGTLLGFFQYLIDSVKYYVQNIVDGINVTIGAIGKVPQIMGTILNFPEPLTALLIFGVTCTIILAIFRR